MARKPIWSRACCTSPPPHSHSALCTSHTHLLTISLCTPTFSQSYHLTLRTSTSSLPTFHTPSNTNSIILSPYHSAHPPFHSLTLSLMTHHSCEKCENSLHNQNQHFHFHFFILHIHLLTLANFAPAISTFSPSHSLQYPPSNASPCHHCANVPESVHLQAPKLSSPPLRFPLSSGLSSMHHPHLLCLSHQAEHHHWFHYSLVQLN